MGIDVLVGRGVWVGILVGVGLLAWGVVGTGELVKLGCRGVAVGDNPTIPVGVSVTDRLGFNVNVGVNKVELGVGVLVACGAVPVFNLQIPFSL